jgi:hypothetical protein
MVYLLALPLLMAGIVADHAQDTGALDDLALVANFLDAWSHLHVQPHNF